jgi:hypothetical protein
VQGSPFTGEQHLRTATARQRWLVILNLELMMAGSKLLTFFEGKVQIEVYF